MLIDLHAHSDASDGTDSPAGLVSAAAAAGIDVLAITDHDTTGGWAEAGGRPPAGDGPDPRVGILHPGGGRRPHGQRAPARVPVRSRRSGHRRRAGPAEDRAPAPGPGDRRPAWWTTACRSPRSQVMDIAGNAPVGPPAHRPRAGGRRAWWHRSTRRSPRYLAGRAKYYVPKVDTDLPYGHRDDHRSRRGQRHRPPRGRGERRVLTADYIGELAAAGLTGLEVDHPDHERGGPGRTAADRRRGTDC